MQGKKYETTERGKYPRIYLPMPLEISGEDFSSDALTQNLNAGGVCFRSSRKFISGDAADFPIELSVAGTNPSEKPNLSARAVVARVRDLGDGTYEFATKFTHSKLLYSGTSASRF